MTAPIRLSKRDAYKAGLNVLYFTGTHRLLASIAQGVGAILMLHRVTDRQRSEFDPNGFLEVTPDFLTDAVTYLREQDYDIVSMDEACRRLREPSDRRFVAITFDDGYRDNYEVAYPLLKRLSVPFTVYVASGFIDWTLDLWWIALERMIAHRAELAVQLRGREKRFDCAKPAQKLASFHTLQHWLTTIADEDEQRATIQNMAKDCDFDLKALNSELAMTWNEVRRLTDDPLVTVGAHTVGHYAVARLDADRARKEIVEGTDRIEKMTGKRPEHFAYPYGNPSAAGPRDFKIAADLGFKTAVTTRPGLLFAEHGEHMTALPRVSLNGEFQNTRYLDLLMTGGAFALHNRFRRLNVD